MIDERSTLQLAHSKSRRPYGNIHTVIRRDVESRGQTVQSERDIPYVNNNLQKHSLTWSPEICAYFDVIMNSWNNSRYESVYFRVWLKECVEIRVLSKPHCHWELDEEEHIRIVLKTLDDHLIFKLSARGKIRRVQSDSLRKCDIWLCWENSFNWHSTSAYKLFKIDSVKSCWGKWSLIGLTCISTIWKKEPPRRAFDLCRRRVRMISE